MGTAGQLGLEPVTGQPVSIQPGTNPLGSALGAALGGGAPGGGAPGSGAIIPPSGSTPPKPGAPIPDLPYIYQDYKAPLSKRFDERKKFVYDQQPKDVYGARGPRSVGGKVFKGTGAELLATSLRGPEYEEPPRYTKPWQAKIKTPQAQDTAFLDVKEQKQQYIRNLRDRTLLTQKL